MEEKQEQKQQEKQGYLKIICGSMFSGKTTEIFTIVKKIEAIYKNVLLINHSSDKRYSDNGIGTHNKLILHSEMLNKLGDIFLSDRLFEDFLNSELIIIDELQFFSDAYEMVLKMVDEYKKKVIIVSLDGDINRNSFGDVVKLLPHCDSIKKMKGYCSICNNYTKSIFTIAERKLEHGNIEVGNDIYKAVCRKHWLEWKEGMKKKEDELKEKVD